MSLVGYAYTMTMTMGSNTRVWVDPCVKGKVAAAYFPHGCPCSRCVTIRLANALMSVPA